VISFRLDGRSVAPPYLQIVQQVKQALRMGVLDVGDKLPTVREVVAATAINPNTVLKAYRDLERDGLVEARAGHDDEAMESLLRAALQAETEEEIA